MVGMTHFDEALVAWWIIALFVLFVVWIFQTAKEIREQRRLDRGMKRIVDRYKKGGDDA